MRIAGPVLALASLMALLPLSNASSEEKKADADFASSYLATLDQGDFQKAYTYLSPSFQSLMSLPSFVANYQAARQKLGAKEVGQQIFKSADGRSERQIVAQDTVTTPNGPATRVRFRTIYPNTVAFEDVYMQPTPAGPKIVGTWVAPGF